MVAGFALFGWLAGVGAAALLRRRIIRRLGRAAFVTACALLLLVGATVAYDRGSLAIQWWGCPSQAELQRHQSVEEVVIAFARHDLELESIPLPVWLPASEPCYGGARVFRHRTPQATTYVVVCRGRCSISRSRFAEAGVVGQQRWYMSLESNNNVPILVTEAGRGDGLRMLEATAAARRDIHPYIEYGSRCYIR